MQQRRHDTALYGLNDWPIDHLHTLTPAPPVQKHEKLPRSVVHAALEHHIIAARPRGASILYTRTQLASIVDGIAR
jgi:hypothetical protein